ICWDSCWPNWNRSSRWEALPRRFERGGVYPKTFQLGEKTLPIRRLAIRLANINAAALNESRKRVVQPPHALTASCVDGHRQLRSPAVGNHARNRRRVQQDLAR